MFRRVCGDVTLVDGVRFRPVVEGQVVVVATTKTVVLEVDATTHRRRSDVVPEPSGGGGEILRDPSGRPSTRVS